MKRMGLLLVALALSISMAAQDSKVHSAIKYLDNGQLDKALSDIEEACVHKETKYMAMTWYWAAEIYYKIGLASSDPNSKYKDLCPDWAKKAREALTKRRSGRGNSNQEDPEMVEYIANALHPHNVESADWYNRNIGNDGIVHGDRKYQGAFSIPRLGFDSHEEKKGKAKYEYRDAPDGSRIYEGVFVYTFWGETNGHSITVTDQVYGLYYGNKQLGEWKWISKYGYDIEDMTLNFNNNGRVDGTFSYYLDGRNLNTKHINGTFSEGKLIKLSHSERRSGIKVTGNYSSYKIGKPVGVWTISGKDVPNGKVTIEFDNYGNLIKHSYFEPTTGDKYDVPTWICNQPESIYEKVIGLVRGFCYRGTEFPKK